MNDYLKMLLAFLFGAGGLALINVIQERWKWRVERKAKKEDRQEAKQDTLDEMNKKLTSFIDQQKKASELIDEKQKAQDKEMAVQSAALRYILLDRIIYIGQSYIKRGEVSFDDRKRLRDMHNVYHNSPDKGGLGGNGDADQIMRTVDELPLKQA